MKRTPTLFGALALTSIASVSTPVSATTEPVATEPGFTQLLSMMPADALADESAFVSYTDMALLWDRVGAGTDDESRLDSMVDLASPETYSVLPQVFGNRNAVVDEARAEVGFSFLDIDRELAVTAPPHSIFIDVTSVSPDAIDTAIEADPVWSERLTRVDSDHGAYIDWGDGAEVDPAATSPFRPLGQAGQLAVLGDPATTVRTLDAADVEAVLATTAGDGESATTTDVIGPIVDMIGDDVVLQAVVQPSPTLFAPPVNASAAQVEAILAEAELVEPYLGIAIVETASGESTRVEALLVYPNDATAADNVAVIETALAEGVDFATMTPLADMYPDASVSTSGAVVRVDVSGEGSFGLLFRQLLARTLFAS